MGLMLLTRHNDSRTGLAFIDSLNGASSGGRSRGWLYGPLHAWMHEDQCCTAAPPSLPTGTGHEMQHFGKGAVRVVKNYTKGYSETQSKVRDATSNDPWGPSGTQMNEIAQLTYNQGDFVEIMEMLDKRLNDKGKNWRHVFKVRKFTEKMMGVDRHPLQSLTLLDYLLHQGSENVIIYFKDNLYVIKTLKEFQFVDEEGKDQGGNVRAKAKDITNLLQDESRLRTERRARANMRERMVKGSGEEDGNTDFDAHRHADENGSRRAGNRGDDDEMRRAIEESKKSLRQDQMKKEENELAEAIRLSEEEEAKRLRGIEDSNAKSLFDDQTQLPAASNNPFPMFNAQQQQQQQQQQLQPQFIQPQFTAFNPYQQQAEMEQQPPQFNLGGTYDNASTPVPSFQSPSPQPQQQSPEPTSGSRFKVKVNDGDNQHLASLFANREDGQDTFGNTGALRYGTTAAGLRALQNSSSSGHNPFQRQQAQQSEQPFFNI
ncbi:unnamed protein product [Mycena citricolor]|uniref:ENTH domain-containing protein n=1 Tax=Mycena citricolor TaxID=2018698 RepID=A0AAD2HAB5_9AGAR|nr:unnamed protein product [Mycena citricolor]CAK5272984.1 unnamed protein product [Mycena citricolor]